MLIKNSKQVVVLFTLLLLLTNFKERTSILDPTGTYDLDSKTVKKGEEVYGYSGQIMVRMITNGQIAIFLEVNKGAPSYNSGSFTDTLNYKNDKAIYTDPELDETCKITFSFSKTGILVKEETADYNLGCGFGHGVVADGFYKKTSSKVPDFTQLESE